MDSSNLAKRLWSSVLILILVGIIIFYFPNWVFLVLASFFIGFSLYEFFNLIEKKGVFVYKYIGVIIGMLVPVIIYFQMGIDGYFNLEPFFIVFACLFIFVLQFARRDNSDALTSIAVTMFGLLYISWFLSFFIKIKLLADGSRLVAFLILVTKGGDIGAYFAGNSLGKHNLIPRISPNKTIEGTIGGLIFSLLIALLSKSYLPKFSLNQLVLLGVLLGILAQVGDLAESLLKRACGAKDSGANISGFGGMLDVVDSLLFTTPIFYFYLKIFTR
ncbi:MAG: phosphatidate cytidylyltransferase [Candidatus Omnitrophica bacterium]|nr:phosphatidate cytidylyltransferase [Candidatus Omnitrophota bacterium]